VSFAVVFLATLLAWLPCSNAQTPAVPSFRSPFHPDECTAAITEARRQLRMHPKGLRWQRVLADGFLCLGLKDDPVALDRAASLFRIVLARAPGDLRAQVGLADALRRCTPLSTAALIALQRAEEIVASVDASRDLDLRGYIAENLAALRQRRAQFLGTGAKWKSKSTSAPLALRGRIEIDLERSPDAAAQRDIGLLLRTDGPASTALAWQAELLRRKGFYGTAMAQFRWIIRHPCAGRAPANTDCDFAAAQLSKLTEQCAVWRHVAKTPADSPCVQSTTAARAAEGGISNEMAMGSVQ
jgi:hypothetical protein